MVTYLLRSISISFFINLRYAQYVGILGKVESRTYLYNIADKNGIRSRCKLIKQLTAYKI